MPAPPDNPLPAVVCGFCGHKNVAGSKFCNDCGAALRLTLCPGCEAVNERSFARCYKCGTELSPAPEAVEASPELSGSAPMAPADAASEIPSVEPVWTPPAAEAVRRRAVPEATGLALESTSTTPGPARISPSEMPDVAPRRATFGPAPPRRPLLAPVVIIGLTVIAAAAYFGYRNGNFEQVSAWLDSTPAWQALVEWVDRVRGSGSATSEKSAAYAPGSATASDAGAPQDDAPPASATAPVPAAETAPAPTTPLPVAETTPQPSSGPAGDQAPASNADAVSVPSTPPVTAPAAPADASTNSKPAATCSDAAVAMGLCKQPAP